ncbi:MAG: hypothetical protein C4547_04965 [Phycisphaerales bacterium]|nr:MAG: hypothetical protein C4547_04965 [Phycisphaerales bacterium]
MFDTKTHTVASPKRERGSSEDRLHETTPALATAASPERLASERPASRAESDVPRGLCASCTLAQTCAYRRSVQRAVMFCDEFDGAQLPPAVRRCEPLAAARLDEAGLERRSRGLCATCTKRDGCTYPHPEGGVWHCEEFE